MPYKTSETMRKQYLSAPLPFQGQKRMFAKEYIKVLQQFPDNTTFVDLFGGSGLLSHIAKCQKPDSTVVYNDFDSYRLRLERIPQTNELLSELREIVDVPRYKPILGEARERILSCIRRYERTHGYVDYITLSTSVLFSMKYATSFAELEKETFYNRVKSGDYPLCSDYLEGLSITSCDYKKLFERYKSAPDVVFLVDPPYLSTESKTYKMDWELSDYLDVLAVLSGHRFIYFTSDKSSIVELCEWIGKNNLAGNPFENCHRREFNGRLNYSASYTDIMLYPDVA